MHAKTLQAAAVAALVLHAAPAGAQMDLDIPESPRNWTLHLQTGNWLPDVDSESGLTGTPFRDVFGDDGRLMTQLGLERYVFDAFGTLGIGLSVGYSEIYGRGFFAEGPNAGERSEDLTTMRVVPVQLFAAYRFDMLARAWEIPLVPYGKAGIGSWFWWSGENGAQWGYSYGGGLQLLLDFFDSRLAMEFDRNFGVNNSYLYVDWAAWVVDDFGGEGLVLSDDGILSFGLALDF